MIQVAAHFPLSLASPSSLPAPLTPSTHTQHPIQYQATHNPPCNTSDRDNRTPERRDWKKEELGSISYFLVILYFINILDFLFPMLFSTSYALRYYLSYSISYSRFLSYLFPVHFLILCYSLVLKLNFVFCFFFSSLFSIASSLRYPFSYSLFPRLATSSTLLPAASLALLPPHLPSLPPSRPHTRPPSRPRHCITPPPFRPRAQYW